MDREATEVVQRVADTVAWALQRVKPPVLLGAMLGAALTVAEVVEPNKPLALIAKTLGTLWQAARAGHGTPQALITTATPIVGRQ